MKLEFIEKTFKTEKRYYVKNKRGDILGVISYFSRWKCWVWEQDKEIVMSKDCLWQVYNKLTELDGVGR